MKKIGNTFSKGIKIGMLSAALAMGAVNTTACKLDNDVTIENISADLESYYFVRHRFAAPDDTLEGKNREEKIAWSNQHHKAICEYMEPRVRNYLDTIANENGGDNFLKAMHDRASYPLAKYNIVGADADQLLPHNLYAASALVGTIAAKRDIAVTRQEGIENKNCYIIEALYEILAIRAYNDSLGVLKDSEQLPINRQRNDSATILNDAQGDLHVVVNDTENLQDVEDALKKVLEVVAAETGVSMATLTETVNIGLLYASMYGARDLAARQMGIQISSDKNKTVPCQGVSNMRSSHLSLTGGYTSQMNQEKAQQQDNLYGK